jgi:hypothetical protein
MGKNQNTWSHRTKIIFREIKIIFHPLGSIAGFPAIVIVLWQENVRGTWNASLADDRYNSLWMWFLNVWENVLMDLKYVCQQYFTCMCFLGFIRYNKTFVACGFRKYENLFTHEYHIPLGRCPQGKWWYSWVNKFSHFPHQHAINVYSLAFCTFSFQFKESTPPDTRCLIQDVVSPHCGDKSMARYCTRSSPSNYFIMTSYHWNAG